jgi:DNA topoisomerase-1
LKKSKELIDAIADAPVAFYKGRCSEKCWPFWSFIKWNSLFINVSKKYDFDNLSQADIETLIEDKLQKTLIKSTQLGRGRILVEKAQTPVITKGKIKSNFLKRLMLQN